jgi:hypothetical protein
LEEMWRKKQSEAWSDFSWGNAMSNKGVEVWDGKDELVDPGWPWGLSWQFYIWLLPLDSMPPISSLPWGCDALLSPAPKLGVSSIATWFTHVGWDCDVLLEGFEFHVSWGGRASIVIDFQYLGLCFSGFLIRGRSHLEHGFQRQNASVHWVVNKKSRHEKHMMQCK